MSNNWIGQTCTTKGLFHPTHCEGLMVRHAVKGVLVKAYRFTSIFDKEYYITEPEHFERIHEMLVEMADMLNHDESELHKYLHELVVTHFGVMEFMKTANAKIARAHEVGFEKGRKSMQKDMRELLGIQ